MAKHYTKTAVEHYWDCGNPKHSHRTQKVAEVCEAKQSRIAAKKAMDVQRPKPDNTRTIAILKSRHHGVTYSAIAKEFSLSTDRVREIVLSSIRKSINPDYSELPLLARAGSPALLEAIEFFREEKARPLGVRAKNCLLAEGLRSVNDVRLAYENNLLGNISNIGPTSISEIVRWLGNEPDDKDLK